MSDNRFATLLFLGTKHHQTNATKVRTWVQQEREDKTPESSLRAYVLMLQRQGFLSEADAKEMVG